MHYSAPLPKAACLALIVAAMLCFPLSAGAQGASGARLLADTTLPGGVRRRITIRPAVLVPGDSFRVFVQTWNAGSQSRTSRSHNCSPPWSGTTLPEAKGVVYLEYTCLIALSDYTLAPGDSVEESGIGILAADALPGHYTITFGGTDPGDLALVVGVALP